MKKPAEGPENRRLRLRALVASPTVRIGLCSRGGRSASALRSSSAGPTTTGPRPGPVRPAPPAKPARGPVNPPVVILLLDEFPADVLLGRDGRIDPVRYPNFARLAREGYWFPNATTVYDSTHQGDPGDPHRPDAAGRHERPRPPTTRTASTRCSAGAATGW